MTTPGDSFEACPAAPSAQEVSSYYDTWTPRYLEAFGDTIQAHRPTGEEDLHAYLMRRAGLRDGKRALDAGSGVCGPALYFAGRADVSIEALTLSPVQARMARQRIAERGLTERVRVQVGDFHRLPELYPREEFDVVYFLESLSHSPAPERALAGVYEVLKPGGIVYVKDFFIKPCRTARERRRVMQVIERVDRLFAVKTARADDVIADLRATGFLPVWVEAPRFEVDNGRWQRFERDNELDLFAGEASFDWSQWLELKFQKP